MKVKFLGSFKDNFPKDKPHVVFVGRSNVGKSSLIKMLVGRGVARVSKEPGRTRAVNVFELEERVYLVDVPGYGFAKTSRKERQIWKHTVEKYFQECDSCVKMVFVLIDSVVGLTELDQMMLEWLESLALPYTVVLTKIDKANQKEINESLKKIKSAVGNAKVIRSSSKEGMGKKEVLTLVFSYAGGKEAERAPRSYGGFGGDNG